NRGAGPEEAGSDFNRWEEETMTTFDEDMSPKGAGFRLSRRGFLSGAAAMTVAAALARPGQAFAQDAQFCASLGWTVWESGRHIVSGYQDAIDRLGGSLTIADANYDVKKQADQIAAFVASKPAAIFITPADA